MDVFAVKQLEACAPPAALNVRDCSQCLDTSLSVPLEEEIIVSCHFLPGREQDFRVRRDNATVTYFGAGCIFNPMTQEAYASTRELGNCGFFLLLHRQNFLRGSFPPLPLTCFWQRLGFQAHKSKIKCCYSLESHGWRSVLHQNCKQDNAWLEGWRVSQMSLTHWRFIIKQFWKPPLIMWPAVL